MPDHVNPKWRSVPPAPRSHISVGRALYLPTLIPAVGFAMLSQPVAGMAAGLIGVFVVLAVSSKRLDPLWVLTCLLTVASASVIEVHDLGPYGLGTAGGCVPPPDSLAYLASEGPYLELEEVAFVLSLPRLALGLVLALPALLAPVVRRFWKRRPASVTE